MEESERYYIRGGDGRVFGPVSLSTLVSWARDARIEPTFSVSRDKEDWQPAPCLAALEMVWLVETEPGTFYGPFNRAVVDQLRAAGHLPAAARLYRAEPARAPTGEPPAEQETARLKAELSAAGKALADLEARAAAQAETTQRTMTFLESRIAQESAARAAAEAAGAAEAAALRDALAAAQDEIYALRARVEQESARAGQALADAQRLETAVAAAEAEREAAMKRLAVAETDREDLRAQLASVTRVTQPPACLATAAPAQPAPLKPELVEPEVVVAEPPPKATPRFAGKATPAGLAALEAAARRELAAAKKQGLGIGGLFGGRK